MRNLELYVHIPFCIRKCAYCDFLSMSAGRDLQRQYIEALKKEIRAFPNAEQYCVSTVFFGGGTPSILPWEWTGDVMDTLQSKFSIAPDAEISLECNPKTADEEKLRAYRSMGINRLSIGLQSAHDAELAMLGRVHTRDDFEQTWRMARAAGFANINVDLMSALPGQTAESWKNTLECVLSFGPEHISAYSLIIEEGTPFYEMYREEEEQRSRGEIPEQLPSEEEERRMYEMTGELLSQAGMHRYEISNYARTGYECRHNIGYWKRTEYAGFGLGAASLLAQQGGGENRFTNPVRMQEYLSGGWSKKEELVLDRNDQMEEFLFLGLRMMEGIKENEFVRKFGKTVDEVYGEVIERQMANGLLARGGGRIFLTQEGIHLSNTVMAEFLL